MTECHLVDWAGLAILGLVALGLVGAVAHMLIDGIREWIVWQEDRRHG